ncbi:MAG: sugar transferase [Christensenellales bacterium]|jgi:undecaprenyl phosphate N,N'-diacetylbacillosamine 1-phosphate transferase
MSAQIAIKYLLDFVAALLILLVLTPLLLVVAVLVKIESPGSVFFIQKRPGYKGKLISVFKFRTMHLGSEKMIKGQEVTKDDPRVTKVGKILRRLKIDELPQLINVLLGQMSLVGPRPERVESLTDYDDFIWKRLDMRPGLTGLAQVSGNIYISLMQRYQYDVFYVENYSLLLDIRILLRTVGVVLRGEEKYANTPLVNLSAGNMR